MENETTIPSATPESFWAVMKVVAERQAENERLMAEIKKLWKETIAENKRQIAENKRQMAENERRRKEASAEAEKRRKEASAEAERQRKEASAEAERRRKESERQRKEAERQRKEADEKFEQIRAENERRRKEVDEKFEQIRAENERQRKEASAETDRRRKEADEKFEQIRAENERQRKEAIAETDRQIKKVNETLGSWANNQGSFAEEYFFNSFEQGQQNFFGEKFDKIQKQVLGITVDDEYDIMLINGKSIGIIEVKYKGHKNDIPKVIKKAETFRQNFPDYKNHKVYLGLATMAFYPELEQECINEGIAVIKQSGDTVIINDDNLKAF